MLGNIDFWFSREKILDFFNGVSGVWAGCFLDHVNDVNQNSILRVSDEFESSFSRLFGCFASTLN